MSKFLNADSIRQAPALSEILGLEPDSFSQFLAKRDKALADRQADHEALMCESMKEELAWAE